MLNRPSNGFIKRVVVFVGVLLAMSAMLVLSNNSENVVFAQEAGPIMYAENGTDPVRRFQSEDPEGRGVSWDVTGVDADYFDIDAATGVLTFKKSPNFESPNDNPHDALDLNDDGDTLGAGEAEQAAANNMYQITVRASEMRRVGYMGRALSTEAKITVQVTDEEELGKVELNWLQPEVATAITATFSDPDGETTVATWNWFVSTVANPDIDFNGNWTGAAGTNASQTGDNETSTYTPVADDEGKFLRAVVTYTDDESGTTVRTVRGMSAYHGVRYAVRANARATNGSPGFSTSNPNLVPRGFTLRASGYAIDIPENMATNLGGTVEASDPNSDTLTYQLDNDADATNDIDDTGDVGSFSIDKKTGQVSVSGLNHEKPAVVGGTGQGQYMFFVRAVDPSGADAEVRVTVTATEANDTPEIAGAIDQGTAADPPAELSVNEQDSDDLVNNTTENPPSDGVPDTPYTPLAGNTYTVSDEDKRYEINWSLEGLDAAVFILDATVGATGDPRELQFRQAPDYESPLDADWDSVYKVTLVASDGKGGVDKRPVTVFVTNVAEHGKGVLESEADNPMQPEVGKMLTASVEDPDQGVTIVTWQWSVGDTDAEEAEFTPIDGATAATYTPTSGDKSKYLRATATYLDAMSEEDDPLTAGVDERVQTGDAANPMAKDPAEDDTGAGLYRVMVTSAHAVQASAADDDAMPKFSAASYQRAVFENAEEGSIVGLPVTARLRKRHRLGVLAGVERLPRQPVVPN